MNDKSKVLIENTEISKRSKMVLTALGVHSIDDLKIMYLLNTIPTIGTNIDLFPFVKASIMYTRFVNDDVKTLLATYCDVEELDNVGVQ
jgi:hypothetical protein